MDRPLARTNRTSPFKNVEAAIAYLEQRHNAEIIPVRVGQKEYYKIKGIRGIELSLFRRGQIKTLASRLAGIR